MATSFRLQNQFKTQDGARHRTCHTASAAMRRLNRHQLPKCHGNHVLQGSLSFLYRAQRIPMDEERIFVFSFRRRCLEWVLLQAQHGIQDDGPTGGGGTILALSDEGTTKSLRADLEEEHLFLKD